MIPHIWVEPELLAEIEYRAKSAEGKVRHPFLRGAAGEFVMKEKDAFDLWWEWAEKPVDSADDPGRTTRRGDGAVAGGAARPREGQ